MSKRKMSERAAKALRTRRRNATRQKAKRAERAAHPRTPSDRLYAAGSTSIENTQRRLQWLAHLRQIPAEDMPTIKRTTTRELVDFAEKYGVSLDWLLGGELKHLHRMLAKFRAAPPPQVMTGQEYEALPPDIKQLVSDGARAWLAERGLKEPDPA
jgi:hypothetical protein